jgi:hypothetical protein
MPALAVTLVAGAILLSLAGSQNKIPLPPLSHKIVADFFLVVAGVGLQVHALGPVFFPQIPFAWFQVALFGIVLAPMSPRVRMGCFALLLYGWLALLAGFLKARVLGGTAPDFNYDDTYFFALAIFEWLVVWRIVSALLHGTPTLPNLMIVSAMGSAAIVYPHWHIRPALPGTNWAQYAGRIEAGETVNVPIYPPPWFFHVAGRRKQLPRALLQLEPVFLLAPDSILFKPAPGNYVASGTFGIQTAALKDVECARNNPDAIGASLVLNHAGNEKVLWHSEIDPFHASPDHGPQHFRVESIDIGEDDELIYRVDLSHERHNVNCDWSYIRDFVLRRRGNVGLLKAGPGAIFWDDFD